MRLNERIQGLEKVKFWLVVLLTLLSASIGLWFGQHGMSHLDMSHIPTDNFRDMGLAYWKLLQELYYANPVSFYAAVSIAVIAICVSEYLYQRFRPKKRKGWRPTSLSDMVLLQIVLYISFFSLFAGAAKYSSFEQQMLDLIAVTLGMAVLLVAGQIIMVLRDVYFKRNSEDYVYFERHKKKVLSVTTAIGLVLIGLPMWLPGFWYIRVVLFRDFSELLGYYTALLSLTFITISVMGVLSDRSVVIYWDNIAEGKLIKPVFGSFAAFTYYSVGATIGAGISVAVRNAAAFIVFGLINISVLIILTFNMVDVYYDREGKKSQRVKELYDDLRDYLWVCTEQKLSGDALKEHRKKIDKYTGVATGTDYTDAEIRNMRIGHRNYEEKMMLLCQHINRANADNDLVYLQEVYDLFVKNLVCFNSPSGKRVAQMLYTNCNELTWPLIYRSIRDLLEYLEKHQVRDEDPFADAYIHKFDQDVLLWQSLLDAEHFKNRLRIECKDAFDQQELYEIMRLVVWRWVILYNDLAAHGNNLGIVKPIEIPANDISEFRATLQDIKRSWQQLTIIFQKKPVIEPENVKYDYLILDQQGNDIFVRTTKGNMPDPVQSHEILEMSLSTVVDDSSLSLTLIQLILLMLENLTDNNKGILQRYLVEFPLPHQIAPLTKGDNSPKLTLLWKKFFPN